MLIKAVRTGRKTFGDKVDAIERGVTIEGVKLRVEERDTWSSGEHPGDGEYIRITAIYGPLVDPWPNLKMAPRKDEPHADT